MAERGHADPGEQDEVARAKAQMRRERRALLCSVPAEALREAGSRIALHLASDPAWSAARVVAAFASLPDEVCTEPLLRAAIAAGKQVLLPRVQDGGRLDFVELSMSEGWRVGRFGIREPAGASEAVPLTSADVVLVPGLAFDRAGGRLGRGAGYYDRALAPCLRSAARPALIGLALASQIVSRVPRSAHDVRVDRVVTERGWSARARDAEKNEE